MCLCQDAKVCKSQSPVLPSACDCAQEPSLRLLVSCRQETDWGLIRVQIGILKEIQRTSMVHADAMGWFIHHLT